MKIQDLEQEIRTWIKGNNRHEITGDIMQRIFLLVTGNYVHVDAFASEIQGIISRIQGLENKFTAIEQQPDGLLKVENNQISSTDTVDCGDF